jgi:hypothetical protein
MPLRYVEREVETRRESVEDQGGGYGMEAHGWKVSKSALNG